MSSLKKVIEVVNNFTGSVSHGELVAFSKAQPIVAPRFPAWDGI